MTRTTTFDDFLLGERRRSTAITTDVIALLDDLAAAARAIAQVAATDARAGRLEAVATRILLNLVESGGTLAAMSLGREGALHPLPAGMKRGSLRLALEPVVGAAGVELGVPAGTLFSIRSDPGGPQLCAGYALYGPATLLVVTLGHGAHGFTLDPASGDFVLTRPEMTIPGAARELAVDPSKPGLRDPSLVRYVAERGGGAALRWTGTAVVDVHRVLLRGGVFLGELAPLPEAAALAFIVEQAGGAAATWRGRNILELEPASPRERAPVILGSRAEVERLVRYHDEHHRGVDRPYRSPLFGSRSLFSEP